MDCWCMYHWIVTLCIAHSRNAYKVVENVGTSAGDAARGCAIDPVSWHLLEASMKQTHDFMQNLQVMAQ